MINVNEAITRRKTTRNFLDKKLSDEQIQLILEAGLKAPTATNKQEIHFTVINNKEILNTLDEKMNVEGKRRPSSFYYNAPTFIVLSGPKDFYFSKIDAGIAVENMVLAAEELGLGTCIIGCLYKIFEEDEKLNELLKFKEGDEHLICLAIGYSEDDKLPHTFNFNDNVTFLD